MIKVMATLGCAALLGGVSLGMQNAAAEPDTLGGVDVTSFRMDYGASVRIKDTEVLTDNGIRFAATISDTAHDALEKLEKTEGVTVDYGMVIVPYDYIESGKVVLSLATENNANGLFNGKFCFEDTTTGEHTGCNKTHLAAVTYEEVVDDDATDGVHNLRGSLINVKQNNLTRRFTGVGYIAYTHGTTTEYALAGYAYDYETTENANILNNTRSMTYVAQAAIKDNKLDATKLGMLEENYVAPFANNEYAYTVNHYLPNKNGNGYEKISEKLYGKLNTPVSAANIAKSSVTDKAKYKDYATYGFTKDSNTSDIVFANGATELNCYYEARDIVLFDAANETDFNNLKTANTNFTITNNESVGDETGVIKIVSGTNTGNLMMGFQMDKLEAANSANWDYLTVRMYVIAELKEDATEKEQTTFAKISSLSMCSWNLPLGTINLNEWTDFVIPKAFFNNPKSYVINSNSGSILTKEKFDEKFTNCYGVDNMSLGGHNHTFFYTNTYSSLNSVSSAQITYYIDSITWGVDITAPVVTANAKIISDAETYEYKPVIAVKDDIVPNTSLWSATYGPAYEYVMYSVDGSERTEMTASDTGSYMLEKGKNYVLAITATDSGASDLAGNIAYKEYSISMSAVADGLSFDSDAELSYLNLVENGVMPTMEWKENVTLGTETKKGIVQYNTAGRSDGTYGGYLYLNFSDEQIENILSAFYTDSTKTTVNTNFKLVLDMAVNIQNITASKDVWLVSKTYGGMTSLKNDTWSKVELTADMLTSGGGWVSEDAIKNILKGSAYSYMLFYLNGKTIGKSAGPITYYIDNITWSAE